MTDRTLDARSNYLQVLDRISSAASKSGRDPDSVTLIVVSKGRSLDAVKAIYLQGQHEFGENRPEEGSKKARGARHEISLDGPPIIWHMIGHIQRRKAKFILADFDYVHSLDSFRLAERLNRFASKSNRALPVLLEFNMSGESSKYGFTADRFEQDVNQWKNLIKVVESILNQPALKVRGLMTMAPIGSHPEQARPHFQRLRCLRDRLSQHFPKSTWSDLSMGMTDDFEVAIEEGATFVRVGRAIFGDRDIE